MMSEADAFISRKQKRSVHSVCCKVERKLKIFKIAKEGQHVDERHSTKQANKAPIQKS
jgi:hypothetical protein